MSEDKFLKEEYISHMNLANSAKIDKNIEKAIFHYQKAIALNPKYAEAQNNLANLYAGIGNYHEALKNYRDALHAEPAFTTAHLNLAILFFNHQKLAEAEIQLNNVLALDATNLKAQFYLALLKLNDNQLNVAFEIFQNILLQDPSHVESLVNLGVISLKQGHEQQAIDYFTKALALDNTNIEARNNLAATFIHNDRYENALQYYNSLLKEDPNNIEYLYNTAVAEMGLGHIQVATELFSEILRLNNKHFGALSNLAAIKMRMSDKDGACQLLNRALLVNPTDKTSKFMLAAISQQERNVDYCPTYANDLFNHYAMYYEKHMQETLQYNLPKKIWELLHELNFSKVDRALDLGCGTGLSGEILKPFCETLIGVDISQKMLSIATSKNIYTELIEAEALQFLKDNQQPYALIVAADVLPYFAGLEELFLAIKSCLKPAGLFIFTTEISFDEPWKLQESIRYSHNPSYIKDLIKKYDFQIIFEEKVAARKQNDHDLEEIVYGISIS